MTDKTRYVDDPAGLVLLAAFSGEPGTPGHSVAVCAARRVLNERYLIECRTARERRDRWLALLESAT